MDNIKLKACAKINLTLNIKGKLSDGYHEIESIFHTIDLYDEMVLSKSDEFLLHVNIEELNNKDNIIWKAYEKVREMYPQISGVEVSLIKRIPSEAGLGGGSSDCASFLKGINKLYNLNLSLEELASIGKTLGADVVPCLYGGTTKVKGFGEQIEVIDNTMELKVLIVRPSFKCSTSLMFKKFDKTDIKQKYNSEEMITLLKNNNIVGVGNTLYNVFESVIEEKDELNIIKDMLLDKGAVGAILTGSGSCIFGLFETNSQLDEAYKEIKNEYECYKCKSYRE